MAEETKDSPAPGNPGPAPVQSAPAARTSTPPETGTTPPRTPPAKPAPSAATAAPPTSTASPAATKPIAPAAGAKPAAAADGVTRRGFFSWAAVAWVGFTAAIGGCVTTWGRFMFPNVLFEPPTLFKAGKPEDYPPGVVDTRLVDEHGVWIVHDGGKIFALIAICTHLGCPPAWLAAQNKFKCPCHGSGYYKSGINFEGPTPRPLERAKIFVSPDDGHIVVDKGQKFQWELGQWDDPNSFIPG
jgi:cytochrome b6-f complex iron-sulfur subunit